MDLLCRQCSITYEADQYDKSMVCNECGGPIFPVIQSPQEAAEPEPAPPSAAPPAPEPDTPAEGGKGKLSHLMPKGPTTPRVEPKVPPIEPAAPASSNQIPANPPPIPQQGIPSIPQQNLMPPVSQQNSATPPAPGEPGANPNPALAPMPSQKHKSFLDRPENANYITTPRVVLSNLFTVLRYINLIGFIGLIGFTLFTMYMTYNGLANNEELGSVKVASIATFAVFAVFIYPILFVRRLGKKFREGADIMMVNEDIRMRYFICGALQTAFSLIGFAILYIPYLMLVTTFINPEVDNEMAWPMATGCAIAGVVCIIISFICSKLKGPTDF